MKCEVVNRDGKSLFLSEDPGTGAVTVNVFENNDLAEEALSHLVDPGQWAIRNIEDYDAWLRQAQESGCEYVYEQKHHPTTAKSIAEVLRTRQIRNGHRH